MLPVDEVKIEPVDMNDIGLGKSIYTKKQLDEFAAFQDSQGTRKVYLVETAELRMGPGAGRSSTAVPRRPRGY
jgi:hypothetical protein